MIWACRQASFVNFVSQPAWGYKTLTLTMIRYADSNYAHKVLNDEWEAYLKYDEKLGDCHALENPIDDHWIVACNPEPGKVIFRLSAVQGPILLTLVYPFWVEGHDLDAAFYCEGLEYFSKIQLQKIRNNVDLTP